MLRPSANADDVQWAANNAHGDLRKALINVDLKGSRCDQARHVYFDVLNVLAHGKQIDMGYQERQWLNINHYQVNRSMKEHAEFGDFMVLADLLDQIRDFGVADFTDYVSGCAAKVLAQNKGPGHVKLQYPDKPLPLSAPMWKNLYRYAASELKLAKNNGRP